MAATVASAVLLAMLMALLISAIANSQSLQSLNWIAFTGFPMVMVIFIASFARLQQRINIRSPQSRSDDEQAKANEK